MKDRQCGHCLALVKRSAPLVNRVKQRSQIHSSVLLGIRRQIAPGSFQQRTAAHLVSPGVMVQGHGDLNQPLQELALRLGRRPPDIFEDLVSLKEVG